MAWTLEIYSLFHNMFIELYGDCVFDSPKNRTLNGHFFTSSEMTVEMCLSTCREKGFAYSGLQWQIECYCGNEPANRFEWAWLKKCDQKCAGNSNQICGGSGAMSVYSTEGVRDADKMFQEIQQQGCDVSKFLKINRFNFFWSMFSSFTVLLYPQFVFMKISINKNCRHDKCQTSTIYKDHLCASWIPF